MTLELTPLGGSLGAAVAGIDLSGDLGEDSVEAIREAILRHHVLVFRGQDLTPPRQVVFTSRFGTVEPHPLRSRPGTRNHPEVMVLENGPGRKGARNDSWHSDLTFMEEPPSYSVLHALEVPQGRGDTMFCNMARAWDLLSAGMRRMLAPLNALHSARSLQQRNAEPGTDALPIPDIPPPVAHPVMRTHPESGRKVLFVNPSFTLSFEDMTEEEGRPLLETLYAAATDHHNIYRHHWNAGDVVMWDNRAVLHYAVHDYDDTTPRLMHRTTAAGDRPV